MKPELLEMVTAGVGPPDEASWLGVNLTTLWLYPFAIHMLPEASKAGVPKGPSRLVPFPEIVTVGAASPLAESGWATRVELFWLTVQMVGVTGVEAAAAGAELAVVPTTTDSAPVPRTMIIVARRRPTLVSSRTSSFCNARFDSRVARLMLHPSF
jgi:hypothetical protein